MNQTPQPSRRVWIIATAWALAFAFSLALDGFAYRHIHMERTLDHDWARFFRVCGWLPTWLIAGAALWMIDAGSMLGRTRSALGRALFLAAACTASGIAGELLKLIVRRERPDSHDGANFFRPFTEEPFRSSGLGFPSSHATVAFAAAWALSLLFPRATPIWIILAIGCSMTRLLDRAHFLSDCVGAAALSYLVVSLLSRWIGPRRKRL